MDLFQDGRIEWLISEIGSLSSCHVLELGPLEGGHSYMLAQAGAESVTAIEANTHAFLRCLIVKEILGMHSVRFLCGDCMEYLSDVNCPQFDIGIASGILYHMVNPAKLISLLAKRCRRYLFIWTHYYDKEWADSHQASSRFPLSTQSVWEGFAHTLVRQVYSAETLDLSSFCGGTQPYSNWMYRDDIVACLKYFGFGNIKINFDHYEHPHAPAFALLASRQFND